MSWQLWAKELAQGFWMRAPIKHLMGSSGVYDAATVIMR